MPDKANELQVIQVNDTLRYLFVCHIDDHELTIVGSKSFVGHNRIVELDRLSGRE